jgi:hypothetical protein
VNFRKYGFGLSGIWGEDLKGDIIGFNPIGEKGNIKAIRTNWEREK